MKQKEDQLDTENGDTENGDTENGVQTGEFPAIKIAE